jgi:hypothetical protein
MQMDQEPDYGDPPLPPPTREEEEAEAWEYWHQRAIKAEQDCAEALTQQRRELCAAHDKTLAELRRVREVAHAEVERLRDAVRRLQRLAEQAEVYHRQLGASETFGRIADAARSALTSGQ